MINIRPFLYLAIQQNWRNTTQDALSRYYRYCITVGDILLDPCIRIK
jgi:hypothetical protein